MATSEAIDLDLEELTRLHGLAERPRVQSILAAEIDKLKSKEPVLKPPSDVDVSKSDAGVSKSDVSTEAGAGGVNQVGALVTKTTTLLPKYYKDITTYAWDQSDNFMKMYVTINGVQKLPKENVTTEFKNRSFRLRVEDLDGKNYQCHVAYLWDDVVPVASYHKVKTDTVLVMLKKANEKKTWAYVTEREDKKPKTPKLDEKKDPNEGLMDMLKQMYEDGDDEMKRTISKSFMESKNKSDS